MMTIVLTHKPDFGECVVDNPSDRAEKKHDGWKAIKRMLIGLSTSL